jgi:hypothetical protein
MKAVIYVEGKSSSPFANGTPNIERIKSSNLKSVASAVYEEIELIDVLEFDENPDILSVALQKLRHGGLLRIAGTDALQVMRESEAGRIDMVGASEHLLGGRLRLTSAHDLKHRLSSMQMNVTTISIGGFRYLVEARRQ